MSDEESVWYRLLHKLYGEDRMLRREHQSVWWRDLYTLDKCLCYAQNRIYDSVRHRLGNGTEIKFWEEKWSFPWKLREVFSALFELSDNQIGAVADFGEWRNGEWC